MDLCMTTEQLHEFGRRCHLPSRALLLIRNSCCRFVARPELKKLLLRQNRDDIDYRFCPYCWHEDQTPYLRLDWRFRDVTHCKVHGELLESRCTSCAAPLPTHRSILGGRSYPPPVANLAICLYCRNDMRQASNKNTHFEVLANWRRIHFQNAIISAILHGHFQTEADGVKRSVDELPAYLETLQKLGGEIVLGLFGTLSPGEARYLVNVFDEAIQKSRWLKPERGKTTTLPTLELKRWLLETGRLNREVQS